MPRRFWSISGPSVAIESVAERRLQMLDDAVELRDMASPLGGFCWGIVRGGSTASVSIDSGAFALSGLMPDLIASRSSITSERL